ncbi:hypothetical protein WM008_23865 [Vibrio vulnificus]|uniref:hypothetical protein n=2 Tax=Vibrio TaxID=662 RepID=UPI001A2F588C|nr:hypothetical protein [Vibrio vulnificus]EGQ7835360.1 hypothetical protein [Vibrio vulnificus]EHW0628460.1 hypothetical protein [Vibrio vulnificus]EKJ5338324.1 hypothetical protein [Vibrio vulnificus]EKO5172035.1 hypothetical protein [Vibrio vulnificus]
MKNKVVLVKAYFAIEYDYRVREVPSGQYERGLLGKKPIMTKIKEKIEVGTSKSRIDSERLATDLEIKINELNEQGFTVKQVVPVISGDYDYLYSDEGVTSSLSLFTGNEKITGGASFGLGYGYSFTDSLIIIAEK